MAKKSKKKVVTSIKSTPTKSRKTGGVTPTTSRAKGSTGDSNEPLLFGKQNFILLIAGTIAMALGFILMLGGEMPNPEVWDDGLIYSTTRTVIAPLLILGGLVIMIFAIFKKSPVVETES
jgi:hypothetical protein